ncbi:hypothetical protein [Micromonospora sp. WMMD710]|uniref:hypothetical protein n=1 Tax=Micromonospora sp. WMMD710 TaxID=3016085 RepID=UPI002417915B|nr:hypothetical protein [Micromonospora sp. WMMD710]MDG4761295.1 hypothetical protein [Micromonospora sp. WMMD710]
MAAPIDPNRTQFLVEKASDLWLHVVQNWRNDRDYDFLEFVAEVGRDGAMAHQRNEAQVSAEGLEEDPEIQKRSKAIESALVKFVEFLNSDRSQRLHLRTSDPLFIHLNKMFAQTFPQVVPVEARQNAPRQAGPSGPPQAAPRRVPAPLR